MDFLLLNLFLGFVPFVIGMVVSALIIRRIEKHKFKIIFWIVLQFVFSFFLSVAVWYFWVFDFDIMVRFISLPALTAETITISTIYLYSRRRINK